MQSGTKLVAVFFALGAVAITLIQLYGDRVMDHREPDSPVVAAREFVSSDNTVVGMLGGVQDVVPTEVKPINQDGPAASAIAAQVTGLRQSGVLYADLEVVDDRWAVVRAAFVLSGGERLPLRGDHPPLLEPRIMP